MALNLFRIPLASVLDFRRQPLHTRNRIQRKLEAVDVVQHAHVKGSSRGSFLLVAAHMSVFVIMTAISEPMNRPRVTMKRKDGRHVGRKDAVVFFVGQSMGMLGRR